MAGSCQSSSGTIRLQRLQAESKRARESSNNKTKSNSSAFSCAQATMAGGHSLASARE
jgi:hypothetical protein